MPLASQILGLDALKLLKDRNFLVFFLSGALCIPWPSIIRNLSPYLVEIGMSGSTGKAALGQGSWNSIHVLCPFLQRFRFKMTILRRMLAWTVRYPFLLMVTPRTGIHAHHRDTPARNLLRFLLRFGKFIPIAKQEPKSKMRPRANYPSNLWSHVNCFFTLQEKLQMPISLRKGHAWKIHLDLPSTVLPAGYWCSLPFV